MTDPAGFLQIQRRLAPLPAGRASASATTASSTPTHPRARARAGAALHGLRRAVLPPRAARSANLIPDWNDLVHRGRLARRRPSACTRRTTSPSSRASSAPRPARRRASSRSTTTPSRSRRSSWRSPSARSTRAGSCREPPALSTGPQRRHRRLGTGRPRLPRSSSRAPATRSRCTSATTAPGGLLRYGIPDFKLDKKAVDVRVEQLEAEGVEFACGVECGVDIAADELRARHDAVVLATGAQRHRDLELPGRELDGVHLAMPYLIAQNRARRGPARRSVRADRGASASRSSAAATPRADCLGNVIREGAVSVVEIAHGPTPPREREPLRTWPEWPTLMRSYAGPRGGRRAPLAGADARARGP